MNIDEFIDTYSDDLTYLHEARVALRTHPLRGDYAFAEYLDASFCRLLSVFMIGSIEVMLESWRDRDRVMILETYFMDNVSNGDRISNLYEAFHNANIPVDRNVFDDYLAIKYLRNTIVHGRWKDHEKEWLDKRGFPTDSGKLTKEHLDRVEHVCQNMMFYIFLTSQTSPTGAKPDKLVKLDETITRRVDETGILRLPDVNHIIWNNLERIDAYIFADIERKVCTKEYNWTLGRSRDEVQQLGSAEAKRLFYLAARRAGEDDYELLAQHRALAIDGLEFWREYWRRAIAPCGLEQASIQRALRVFQSPHFDPAIPLWSVIGNVSDDDAACQEVESLLIGSKPLSRDEILNALRVGNLAYQLMPSIMPVSLFTVRLPIVDPTNTATYLREAECALELFRLNRTWYSCVEHQCMFTDESLDFYAQIVQEFAERGQGAG